MTTARAYFDGDAEDAAADQRRAKGIVWYDQRTPLFVCVGCHEHVRPLRFQGDQRAANYDARRAAAYQRLLDDAPPCDACSGTLPEKVDL